jgi:hypothetical protein
MILTKPSMRAELNTKVALAVSLLCFGPGHVVGFTLKMFVSVPDSVAASLTCWFCLKYCLAYYHGSCSAVNEGTRRLCSTLFMYVLSCRYAMTLFSEAALCWKGL